jgi:DNA-binding CsgD family transcriptional regulator
VTRENLAPRGAGEPAPIGKDDIAGGASGDDHALRLTEDLDALFEAWRAAHARRVLAIRAEEDAWRWLCERRHIHERDRLSPMERRVYDLVLRDLRNKEIAAELNMSERMAKFHVSRIIQKLGVNPRHRFAGGRE